MKLSHTAAMFALPALCFQTVISSGAAQEPAPIEETTTEAEIATPAMWRVTDEDTEIILLGTFHILPPTLNWRNATLADAFENAEVVYFEVDADAPDAAAKTLNTVMTQGFNAPGVSLSNMLGEPEAQKLGAILAELNLPFAAVDTMRPWNAFLTLSVQFIINQGFEPGSGVDSVLLAEAKTLGKEVRFFETIEGQLALFTGLAPEIEKELLLITIRDWDQQVDAFDELFNAWASGNVDFIDVNMNEDMRAQAPEVYERLIVERNSAWAETLDVTLKEESGKLMVAVGAAHLAGGEFSVPALLAQKGYDVSRYGVETAAPTAISEAAPEAANDNEPATE